MTGYLFYMGCAAGVRLSATEPNRGRRERVRQAPSCPRGTPGPKALSLSESHEAGVREERLSVMASSAPHTRSRLHLIQQLHHLEISQTFSLFSSFQFDLKAAFFPGSMMCC
ncbi:hypothetical protein C4D60_Mb04t20820 [Musa balbisiana]|uniref:Uncharacterized protein n=1 Tax=Musa balbisiana TaxID=52838 RepID=A0A4S8KDI7_MUSBA|nr:hypothetical protein C4D60_Mb04t20820 [Musa balbisiana]